MPLPELMQSCSVINANFERVLSVVNNYLKESPEYTCTCDKCVNRIIAEALNSLPTHYYADKVLEPEMGSPWSLVQSAVAEAAEKIRFVPCKPGPELVHKQEAVLPSKEVIVKKILIVMSALFVSGVLTVVVWFVASAGLNEPHDIVPHPENAARSRI